VTRATRSATDRVTKVVNDLTSGVPALTDSLPPVERAAGGASLQSDPSPAITAPSAPQLNTSHADGGLAPAAHHLGTTLAQFPTGDSKPAPAAGRPSASMGGGAAYDGQPGGLPSPAPLRGSASPEAGVATSAPLGGLGAAGAILFTFILAAGLGLRRLSLASDPFGPAPVVLLPERPG
jgi:hypothetical protein